MAERIQAFDWARTPLGPMEGWPQCLRFALATMLECQTPMAICWGPDFIHLYNDAFRPMLGTSRDPVALGRPARVNWPEVWETVGPMFERMLAGTPGDSNGARLLLDNEVGSGARERPLQFSCSPLRDEAGTPQGLLVAATGSTDCPRDVQLLQGEVDRLRSLFMSAPVAIALLRGREMRFELANAQYQQLVRRTEDELLGRTVAAVFPELAPRVRELLDRVFQTGETFAWREFGVVLDWNGDGHPHERFINVTYEPTRGVDGAIDGLMVVAFDVSAQVLARRKAEKAESRMRFAINASGMGEWELDLRTGQTTRSARYDQCFGHAEMLPSWTYQDFIDRVAPEYRERTDFLFKAAVSGAHTWSFECPVIWPDDSRHWIASQARVENGPDGKPLRIAGLVWDITETRTAHEALREANRQKDEFLATLAHELRNPLAPIRHAAHVLGQPAMAAEHLSWCRDVITRQVSHMALLLDDLLDVSRITTGRIELKRSAVPLSEVVHAAVETVAPLIARKNHTLDIRLPAEPVDLDADALRMAQVFGNLLTNAAKYTDPGGLIELEATLDEQGLRVRLQDNGVGVAPEALPHLFRRFSQLASPVDRAEGGLGIGLALSRGLVELHGGSLSAHSEGLGRGTTLELRLPAALVRSRPAAQEDNPPQSAAADTPPRAGCRVLVVDDNRDAADSLAMLAEMEGHEVMVAYSGADGLTLLRQRRPDIAILDIGMPGMDGYQLARSIREQPGGSSILLVAATGWGQQEDQRRARAAGFDRHLTKPVSPHALLELLAEPLPNGQLS